LENYHSITILRNVATVAPSQSKKRFTEYRVFSKRN
jgi:hypothetical protein